VDMNDRLEVTAHIVGCLELFRCYNLDGLNFIKTSI